ncbi:MAG TPA: nucleotidyltransferase family protein [Planctomycetaceae bacterium]|nr:nucleotidyltransferase family protein [Planctomycetaceae bacterium]
MISAIVLAAGQSVRMGSQKVLLPYGKSTVIEHIVNVLKTGGVDEVVVITGHQSENVAAALSKTAAKIVRNEQYLSGMLSSVRCGVRAASANTQAYLVALGDQPSIRASVVATLVAAFAAEPTDQGVILMPTFDRRRGHPLLFSRHFREDALHRFDETGLRGLLDAYPERIRDIAADESGILRDMDYPADYEFELRMRRELEDLGEG